jgi:2,3-dihydroxy-p-cumate/2,3-dihydroxybenzoate 3,4-dioxygenase
MVRLHDIRYLRVGTGDLDHAIDFATRIVGLQMVAREPNAAYFRSDKVAIRGDTRDHTLVYFKGNPGDQSLGFELRDPDELDMAAAEIERAGQAVRFGTKEECEQRRVKAVLLTEDKAGNKIEIAARPYHSGIRYFPSRDAGITHFSHIGLHSAQPARDESFWTGLFNARVSDWVGDASFLRINTVHHSVVLFPSAQHGIQHINHQVEDIDDLMRSYYFLREQGVNIVWGPGRHPVSTAVMLYFQGPDNLTFEYSVGVKHIMPEEESTYRPRQFPLHQFSLCMWGSRPSSMLELPEREKGASQTLRMV